MECPFFHSNIDLSSCEKFNFVIIQRGSKGQGILKRRYSLNMKIVRMRAVYVTFCVIFLIAVFANGSSDNLLAEENNLGYGCSNQNLFVNFSGSVITILGKYFMNSPLLTCLNLQENQIKMVEKDAFRGLPALQYLNMASNKIVDLTSFGSHENLRTLILANQSYSNYMYDNNLRITTRYPQLRYLDLSGNYISSIDWVMEENSDHKDLSQQIPKLAYLDLSNNNIKQLFTNDFSSSSVSLIYIYLRNNGMLFANLRYFKNVEILIADYNSFEYLRKHNCFGWSLCVSDMQKLKNLSVSNNKLIQIDHNFFEQMPELAMLNLSSNRLSNDLHGVFDDLISLRNLELNNNQLTNISIFKKPLQLSSLSVNLNNIKYINSEDFINMKNLRKLYLNNNDLRNINENAFWSLNWLEELHLANNFLTNLPTEWSNNLESLRYLDVTNNLFKYLDSLSLSPTLPLIRIDLINNTIINFTSKILRDIPENVTIYLYDDQKEIELDTSV